MLDAEGKSEEAQKVAAAVPATMNYGQQGGVALASADDSTPAATPVPAVAKPAKATPKAATLASAPAPVPAAPGVTPASSDADAKADAIIAQAMAAEAKMRKSIAPDPASTSTTGAQAFNSGR